MSDFIILLKRNKKLFIRNSCLNYKYRLDLTPKDIKIISLYKKLECFDLSILIYWHHNFYSL